MLITDSTGASVQFSGSISIASALTLVGVTFQIFSVTVGQPFNYTFQPVGGFAPYTFTLQGGLPPGLSLSSDGVISGTVTGGAGTEDQVNVIVVRGILRARRSSRRTSSTPPAPELR